MYYYFGKQYTRKAKFRGILKLDAQIGSKSAQILKTWSGSDHVLKIGYESDHILKPGPEPTSFQRGAYCTWGLIWPSSSLTLLSALSDISRSLVTSLSAPEPKLTKNTNTKYITYTVYTVQCTLSTDLGLCKHSTDVYSRSIAISKKDWPWTIFAAWIIWVPFRDAKQKNIFD